MRAVVQRVTKAKVKVNSEIKGEIGHGLVVLLAVSEIDNQDTIKWMANKLVNLRIFSDEEQKMNLSVQDVNGGILLVSNFTVYGDVKKGFRPNFMASAMPEKAEPLFNDLFEYMKNNYQIPIATGEFGAMMEVELVNDGPVTVIIEK